MSCPKCNLDVNTFCDNDCGTFYCETHGEYYRSTDGELITGHNPECGVDTPLDKTKDVIDQNNMYNC